jgi:hypothetical protein
VFSVRFVTKCYKELLVSKQKFGELANHRTLAVAEAREIVTESRGRGTPVVGSRYQKTGENTETERT